jgi:hypothetical protein
MNTCEVQTGHPSRRRRAGRHATALVWMAVATVLLVAACGKDTPRSTALNSPASTTSTAQATRATPATPATPSYSTKYFAAPVDVTVPSWLDPTPAEDTAHFVTWGSSDGSRAVRILSPVVVYPPGSSTAVTIPKDYLSYLLSQADHGGHFSDRVQTTVDGRPATVVTATTDQPLDGSLGCPETGIRAADCFGLQPDLILRMAVITADPAPLLIWLRLNVDAKPDMTAESQRFDQFLAGVRFAKRAPQQAPVPAATAFDGVYEWTLTKEDALAHGTSGDKTPESLATYPWKFTITMAAGTCTLHGEFATGAPENDSGTYDVVGNRINFHWSGTTESFTITNDPDGTLHLAAIPPMEAGDEYVHTTKPWTNKRAAAATPPAEHIPTGTYRKEITRADALVLGIDAKDADAMFATQATKTISLVVDERRWTQYESNNGPGEVGDLGTYSYDSAGHWLTVSESSGCPRCLIAFDWQVSNGVLTLALADVAGHGAYDPGVRLVMTGAFTLAPA